MDKETDQYASDYDPGAYQHPDSFADYAATPAEAVTLAHAVPPDLVTPDDAEDDGPDRTVLAAGCVVLASAIWAFQDVAIKDLIGGMAVWQILLFRSVVAAVTMGGLWLMFRGRYQFWPIQMMPHLIRAVLIIVCYTAFYVSLPYVPMADVATLVYSSPIMITLLAIPMLGEKVGIHRSAAVVVGFAGVFVITGMGSEFNIWVLGPLFAALTYSIAMIIVRKVGGVESAISLTLSLNLAYLGISLIMVIAGELIPLHGAAKDTWGHMLAPWVWPTTEGWIMITVLAFLGVGGHFLVSFAYSKAEASAVAVFDYAYIPLATLSAFVLLGETPDLRSYAGMGLIILAGVYVAVRERTVAERKRKERAAKQAAASTS